MATVTAADAGKVELGTGIKTALAQIVAEELDVPFDRVTMVLGDTMLTPDQGTTRRQQDHPERWTATTPDRGRSTADPPDSRF